MEGQTVFETKTLTKGFAKKIWRHAKWSQEKGAQLDNKSTIDPPGQSKEKNQSGVKFDKKYPDNFWSWTIFRGNFVLLIK